MMRNQAAIDAAHNAGWSLKTMFSGGLAGMLGWVMNSGIIGLAGAIISIIGAIATIWFKWQERGENKKMLRLEAELKRREDWRREMLWREDMKQRGAGDVVRQLDYEQHGGCL